MSEYKRLTKEGKLISDCFTSGGFVNIDLVVTRLSELEDKIEAGTLVELPGKKWAILAGIDKYHYWFHERNPIAHFWNGKWNWDYEKIEWCDILEEFSSKEAAEARLKELNEKGK